MSDISFIRKVALSLIMCLGIPAKIVQKRGEEAKVDFGGVFRTINVSLTNADVGEWVIVHAGYAIQVLDEEEAKETRKLFEELLGEGIA